MHANTKSKATVAAVLETREEVVAALFTTLEDLVPHTARIVEKKTQELTKHITGLVSAARTQESNISQLVGCMQWQEKTAKDAHIHDPLTRAHEALTFSLEHNLDVTTAITQWLHQLDTTQKTLSQIEQDLALATTSKQPLSAMTDEMKKTVSKTKIHLKKLQQAIGAMQIEPSAMKRCEADVKSVTELLRQEPVRTRQLQALISDANQKSRAIIACGHAAIMAIQFQDYNSQLAENASCLLRLLRHDYESADAASGEELPYDFFLRCYESITLGEVRTMFMNNINNVHGAPPASADVVTNHIELF